MIYSDCYLPVPPTHILPNATHWNGDITTNPRARWLTEWPSRLKVGVGLPITVVNFDRCGAHATNPDAVRRCACDPRLIWLAIEKNTPRYGRLALRVIQNGRRHRK
jgi:hypothetical protein